MAAMSFVTEIFNHTQLVLAQAIHCLVTIYGSCACWGGLDVFIPTITSYNDLAASRCIAKPLCTFMTILRAGFIEALSFQQSRKYSVHKVKLEAYSNSSSELCQQLEPTLQHAVELVSVKGALNWLQHSP